MSKNRKTVQLLPEKVFFVLKEKFGYGDPYKTMVPSLPFPALMQPAQMRGRYVTLCVHKDHHISKLLVLDHPAPFRSGDTESPKDLQGIVVLKVFGGKQSGYGVNEFYRNELYYDIRVKANSNFDPSFIISAVTGEFTLMNTHKPLPSDLEIPMSSLASIELYKMEKEKKPAPIYY